MATSRDQAARVRRQEAVERTAANADAAPETSAALAEQLRSHVVEETKRRNETPETPVTDKPAPNAPAPRAPAGTCGNGNRAPRRVLR